MLSLSENIAKKLGGGATFLTHTVEGSSLVYVNDSIMCLTWFMLDHCYTMPQTTSCLAADIPSVFSQRMLPAWCGLGQHTRPGDSVTSFSAGG